MDVIDLRKLVRRTIRNRLIEISKSNTLPPTNFSEYRRRVLLKLEAFKAPAALIEDVMNENHFGGSAYQQVWTSWADVVAETSEIHYTDDLRSFWNEAAQFYVNELATTLIESYRS